MKANPKANSRLGYQPSLFHLAGPKYLVYTTPEAANRVIRATTPATTPRQIRLTVILPLLQSPGLGAFTADFRYHFGCFSYERRDKSVESIEALAVLFSEATRRCWRSTEDLRFFMFAAVRFLLLRRAAELVINDPQRGNISSVL